MEGTYFICRDKDICTYFICRDSASADYVTRGMSVVFSPAGYFDRQRKSTFQFTILKFQN